MLKISCVESKCSNSFEGGKLEVPGDWVGDDDSDEIILADVGVGWVVVRNPIGVLSGHCPEHADVERVAHFAAVESFTKKNRDSDN